MYSSSSSCGIMCAPSQRPTEMLCLTQLEIATVSSCPLAFFRLLFRGVAPTTPPFRTRPDMIPHSTAGRAESCRITSRMTAGSVQRKTRGFELPGLDPCGSRLHAAAPSHPHPHAPAVSQAWASMHPPAAVPRRRSASSSERIDAAVTRGACQVQRLEPPHPGPVPPRQEKDNLYLPT